ncbi:MAG: hypothetical protein ABSG77_02130 [Candidatus Acidiferrum sp.]
MKQTHRLRDFFLLLGITAAAVAVHGYHRGIEDMAVYLPAIKKLLTAALYPYDAAFFLLYIRFTVFHSFVASATRATHLPLDWMIFLLHLISIFLFLLGCLAVIRKCVAEEAAQWAGVALVAALLTLPVTGTALFLVDQHLAPRTLASAFLLFATVAVLNGQPRALLWVVLAGLFHPTITAYGIVHLVVLAMPPIGARPAVFLSALPMSEPANPIWREMMSHRHFQYPLRWTWYEWLGVGGPLVLLMSYARVGRRNNMPVLERLCTRFAISTSVGVLAAIITTSSFPTQTWERLEPMRILHLTYVVFVLISGALLGKYILRMQAIRWFALFLPISLGMFYAQRQEFPASRHIELPGIASRNAWIEAFDWVRENTPRNAFFALDPKYMEKSGDDYHGFRGIAERSMLADNVKDPSVVEVFPDLAYQWKLEVAGREKWSSFNLDDFERLKKKFGVGWVILERPGVAGMPCPYVNPAVMVCRIP